MTLQVWIAYSGKTYHSPNKFSRCVRWMYGYEDTLERALKLGLQPCKRCQARGALREVKST